MSDSIIAKVLSTKRAGTSYYGNPSFDVTMETRSGDVLTLRTTANASFGYACENTEYKTEWHAYELTRSGRIRFARKIEEDAK